MLLIYGVHHLLIFFYIYSSSNSIAPRLLISFTSIPL